MNLYEARDDYIKRKRKKKLRFRRCSNCKFVSDYAYSYYDCLVTDKVIGLKTKALFCRYYQKID